MIFGFIGSGKMATALVKGAVDSGALAASEVLVTDKYGAAAAELAQAAGVQACADNAALVAAAEVIVLCVKPGDAVAALQAVQPQLAGKLVVSIVAGLTLAVLQQAAGLQARVVRVMPNTPAMINRGASGYALGSSATGQDGQVVEKLFAAVGIVHGVAEPLLDTVTGLSGSGPAYVYLLIEALADGGVLMGLPRALAVQLAAQTVAGSAEMVLQQGQHPAVLRDAVTSPGGTTAAGLEALEKHGLRAAAISAVRAATERARELGRS